MFKELQLIFMHSTINSEIVKIPPFSHKKITFREESMPKNRVWAIENLSDSRKSTITTNKTHQIPKAEKKKWWIRFKDWFIESLRSYCATTSMHGFSYIIREDGTIGERRAWMLIVLSAIIVSIVLLVVSWNWTEETPTVTVIESTHFPTWNIPFSAVTICSLNKLSLRKAKRKALSLNRPGGISINEALELFKLALYYTGGVNANETQYDRLNLLLKENKLNLATLINDLSPTCKDMLFRCIWKGTQTRCDSLFQAINTTDGICCTFNYYGLKNNNYPLKLAYTIPSVPRRVTGCGYQTGLTVLLTPETKDYFGTYISSYGFRVLIHDPANYPDENAETKVVAAKRESFLSISPETTYATADVRRLRISKRKCLFYDERKLDVLQSYSYVNCLAECRSKLIYTICGCVPLNLPSNSSLRSCDATDILCIVRHRSSFMRSLPGVNQSLVHQERLEQRPCDCQPDCELSRYSAEITSGVLNREYSHSNVNLFKGINITDQILLHVYFNDLISTRFRMDIYQNWLGTLASFGGLLGLIIGFSIVTGFEFIYYLTLRPIFDHFGKN